MSVTLSPDQYIELCDEGIAGIKDGTKNLSWIIKSKNLLIKNKIISDIPGILKLVYGFLYGCSSVTSLSKKCKKIYV